MAMANLSDKRIDPSEPLEGYKLTLAIVVMVNATIQAGPAPVKVVMHPSDFDAMQDEHGEPWRVLAIAGLPIELDTDLEPGKIYALRPLSNTAKTCSA